MTAANVSGIGLVVPWTDDPATAMPRSPHPEPPADWFDTAARLGPRGFRYVPPACRYLLAAARQAVAGVNELPSARTGLVVGTNYANSRLHADLDELILAGDPTGIGPATAPYVAVNLLAGRVALDHRLRAFSLTLTSPLTAGLEALAVGARAVATARCDLSLAGAAEATPAHRLDAAGYADEGAAILVLGRGPRSWGRVDTRTCVDLDGRLAAAIEELAGDEVPVLVFADRRPGLTDRVPPRAELRPASAGALTPLLHLIGALSGGTQLLVVAVNAAGACVLTRATPNPTSKEGLIP